jgi:predicted alpha/beta superfamily hydrolase
MIYFGQDVGEPGEGDAGFGDPTRTTIFDYWGVPAHQRWMNDGRFDGGQLSEDEKQLRDFYRRLLNLSTRTVIAHGEYAPIESGNDKLFAFARWHGDDQMVVVSNFSAEDSHVTTLRVPLALVSQWQLTDGRYLLEDQLSGKKPGRLVADNGSGYIALELGPLESVAWKVGEADIERHNDFASKFVGARHVDVWLPRDYESSDKDYKVLYFHDGQNLFNPEWVYYTQTDWDIDTTLQRLIDEGQVDDTIVVGIWSSNDRISDYMPWDMYKAAPEEYREQISRYMGQEPQSREYLQFIVEELKPFVDANYRTRIGRDDTLMMGSSMGALISLYGVIEYPDVFGGAAAVSTHWPSSMMLDNPEANEPVLAWLRESIPAPGNHRIYFDFGTAELDTDYEPHQQAVDEVMRELGYVEGSLWQTRKFEGAGHNEGAWQERAGVPLKFLLGKAHKKE